MVPAWRRTQRFANAYAFLTLDALYTLLWFAAFISIAVWNSEGIRGGAVDIGAGKNDGNCTTFRFGNESKCKISRATVGFGVMILYISPYPYSPLTANWTLNSIFFAVTTGISAYYFIQYRKNGVLPYLSEKINPHHASGETTKDTTWSAEIDQPHRDSDEEDRRTEHGGNQQEDEYALLHSTETDEGRHPGRPLSWGVDGRSSYATPHAPYASDDHVSALSPGGYEEYRREPGHASLDVDTSYSGRKPAAEMESSYGSGGQGYSFTK
jgi:hypothetical protein